MATASTAQSSDRRFAHRPTLEPGLRRALEHLLLGALPVALTLGLAVAAISSHWLAEDFSLAYYPAAHRLLTGASPYAATHVQIISGAAFVYPALSAVLFVPFALVSSGLADHLYTLLCVALVPATLWAARVKDWRVYGITMLWFPMIIGWQGENISVPLMFLVALAWRYRDRPLVGGLIVAAAVSMKPLVWPLALWLLATRRWKAAGFAFAWALILNLVAWNILGFSEISAYLRLTGQDTSALWREGYSLLAAAHHLGLGRTWGEALLVLAAAVLCGLILQQGLVRRKQRETFALAVGLMLVASPLVWIHYFVLLLVPLAITRPRFSALWVVPIAMWLLPPSQPVDGWEELLAWGVTAVCIAATLAGCSRSTKRLRLSALSTP